MSQRSYPRTARLSELVMAWDGAGRPQAGRLRIDAYPSGTPVPADVPGTVHVAQHATFVVSQLLSRCHPAPERRTRDAPSAFLPPPFGVAGVARRAF